STAGSLTRTSGRPRSRHSMASPSPNVPEVDSMTTVPGSSRPSSRARSRMYRAGSSFIRLKAAPKRFGPRRTMRGSSSAPVMVGATGAPVIVGAAKAPEGRTATPRTVNRLGERTPRARGRIGERPGRSSARRFGRPLPGPEGGDVGAVPADVGVAVAAGAVPGRVDEDPRAPGGGAHPEPLQAVVADDAGQAHGRLGRHVGEQRRF